jgi:DeoR family transcriptional regulator, fructose operon transcriptional repressor
MILLSELFKFALFFDMRSTLPTFNKPLFAEERKAQILELLKKKKKITVPELSHIFHVSGATIRTYLRDLQTAGTLTRTHGGAIEKTQTGFELDANQREIQNLRQKKNIAHIALELIHDGDKIILDTGTTTRELAKLLNEKKNITALTNDLKIAEILEEYESIEILFLGGKIRKKFHCTVGLQGRNIYSGLIFDKAFMGVNSFSLEKGATTPDINHAEIKKEMVKMSNKLILLCDSSKIGKVSFAQFATIEDIDSLVTDQISTNDKEKIEEAGIEVISCSSTL